MNEFLGVHGLPTLGLPPTIPVELGKKPDMDKNPESPYGGRETIGYYGDLGGCSFWRMVMPELHINYAKLGNVIGLNKLIPDPNFYNGVKTVRLQRQATREHLAFMTHLRKIADRNGMKLIYEIDDVVLAKDIPEFNVAKDAYSVDGVYESIVSMIRMCDIMTVSCEYLKDYFKRNLGHNDIRVIPNMASKMWFDGLYNPTKICNSLDQHKKRPRILYAGSGNHFNIKRKAGIFDDFSHVIDNVIKTRKDFKWVLMGGYPIELKSYIDSGEVEYHPWELIPNFPKKIYDLDVNAVIAPLMDCEFNRSKSNIKYLESGYLGIPGVFQDIVTYKDAPIRFKTGDEMIDQLKNLLTNRQYYVKMSKQCRQYANSMWLDDNIGMYTKVLFES